MVGYIGMYIIGVWVGCFDGIVCLGKFGFEMVVLIFFKVFE